MPSAMVASRPAIARLGHEGREQAVLGGDPAHQALPLDRLVGRLQRIAAVAQHDLELARRIFGDERLGRQPHGASRRIELGDEGAELLQLGHAIDIDAVQAPAGRRRSWRLELSIGPAGGIDDIELQFGGDDGYKSRRLQPAHHLREHMARIADIGPAVELPQAEQQVGRGHAHPGGALQCPCDGPGELVGVARVPHQPRLLHVLAGDVEAHDRAGQRPPLAIELREIAGAQQLAAPDARGVGHQRLRRFQVRIGLQEGLRLLDRPAPRHAHVLRAL